ncbi:hypothetical protein GE061_006976 [Apolygus lucorum]|uniref:Uncharacterized protein n=1 Tax=Apolygus lucorum TaxID=248454 RepID=A0A8S9WQM5_APOLU|nr:hypothetical protein GE061_006976 [Apolygus lucorum]
MINSLSSQLNAANNQNSGICRLSDLRIGVPYEVVSFQRLQSRFGDTIVASLIPIGCLQEASIRVFLPKRFNDVLTEDEIQKYNNKVIRSVNLIYRGLVNRQHDLQFMSSSSKQCSVCGANFVTVRACQLHELSCTRASPRERSPSPASPSMWVTNNEFSTPSTDEEEYSDPMNKTYAVMPSSRESPPRKKMKTYSPSPTPSFEDYSYWERALSSDNFTLYRELDPSIKCASLVEKMDTDLYSSRWVFKLGGELLTLNGRPYDTNRCELCFLCNGRLREEVCHFLCVYAVLSEFRLSAFGRPALKRDEAITILNGDG